ncbi:hypothetical protein NB550_11390 [Vibrio parahaemolyticus]|uniref:hypothetical protein n=1 Tax=Vibrio TaxID=662 RepID=UPI0015D2CCAE|nr:hypothetical protein [Vibrio parahaemolyticus]MCR9888164.1 hypothetical protein [Vibrio parahaemolyticus]MCR9918094.1 hypothetical protein [Vibrio parahaemolyticus]NYU23808.1 hypothetical protein [Vibrio parahaemolyticus]WHT06016.1 hypothetical protein O2T11_25550 [Vibrio parahaemolyticus]
MKYQEINGVLHVCFECKYDSTLGPGKFISLDSLDGMYCLLLSQLRNSTSSPYAHIKKLNIKRRRALIYIRRVLRERYSRPLPLDAVKGYTVNNHHAKLKGYTILG